MIYKSTKECVEDLEKNGHLIRIHEELDPDLEIAEVHRRVFQAEGPALLFEHVKGSPFPAVSNLFGTLSRSRFIFRSTLSAVKNLIALKADPFAFFKAPWRFAKVPLIALNALPKKVSGGPVFSGKTSIEQLPQIKCWPKDGGAFILLPQVYSEDPLSPGIMKSNMGMYRVQMSGNQYRPGSEIGLHYQIRRDIGVHHSHALKKEDPLRVSIFVGGPPAHSFAAVMPLPTKVPEVVFAGMLSGRRFRYARQDSFVISTESDFCITGTVVPGETRTEGPFGDHLGYYSLKHEFPFIKVDAVYHRNDAIWPFTIVGRPPQEDTAFGKLIHEITGPMVPKEMPGLEAVHAVDAAGVHPLLLAIGRESYVPYQDRKPQEIITIANAVLGYGQCSLAKYLFVVAKEDNPNLDIYSLADYFSHMLERIDWKRDLHFQTKSTIDTLDYSGTGLNSGSKVIFAAAGNKKRHLDSKLPENFSLPADYKKPVVVMPGILLLEAPGFTDAAGALDQIRRLTDLIETINNMDGIPLIVLVDDSEFAGRSLNNFLWVTFTRSNPSHDIHGVQSFIEHKHWGCHGPLVIDARLKPNHAPPLVEDPKITKRVSSLGKSGGSLCGII